MKVRADQRLLELGLAESLALARALLLGGKVWSGERRIEKAGELLKPDAVLRVSGERRFVSRGGEKLEGALQEFGLNVQGWVCADLGASTGGFVDCLLQRGAACVFAVDVGKGLLARKLAADLRVSVQDETNARDLSLQSFSEPLDLVTVDVSFIGINRVAPAIARILAPGRWLVAMIKPQFEAAESDVSKGRGVIRDPVVREAAISTACKALETAGFQITSSVDSSLRGPKGNLEHFVLARRLT